MNEKEKIQYRYGLMKNSFNEKTKRLFVGAEALAIGHWWVKLVEEATWISHWTISRWKKELEKNEKIITDSRIRKEWWGRKKSIDKNPQIVIEIEKELDGNTIGNPMTVLTRTTKSLTTLSNAIFKSIGIRVWRDVIARQLKKSWYSLKMNKKMIEWWDHIDRNTQFEYIANKVVKFIWEDCPVISIDTKKKELIGNFKNNWKVRSKKWGAKEVNVYDFPNMAKWKAVPYGVYDVIENKWRVSVWVSADTGEFAVSSLWNWRENMWENRYKTSKKIYINCDWWWSNWSRCRLRKYELQKFANKVQKEIHVSHFPPGTSKRNKIEHRLFCHITNNWKWVPLEEFATVVSLISNTKTEKGLTVQCLLDDKIYEKWIKISDNEMKKLNLIANEFHWEWNYVIMPNLI